MMKLQQLRFLVAVVDHGGVMRAAERLHLSQPSISSGLKALEDELGGALFDRSGPPNRPLRLTPAGRRFYERALVILAHCESARVEFGAGPVPPARVRLGLLATLPSARVARALARFEAAGTGIALDCREGQADRLAGALARQRLDLLWSTLDGPAPGARLLWREPLVAVAAPGHALARDGACALHELARFPFVHRANCELDALGRGRLAAAGVKLAVRMRVEREELAFELVRGGAGITLAPRGLLPPDLVAIEVAGLDITRGIGLRARDDLPAPVLDALARAIDDEAGTDGGAGPAPNGHHSGTNSRTSPPITSPR